MDLQNKNQSAIDDELKQTYEFLKDIEKDLLEEKNELIKILSKKPVETLSPSVSPEDIQIEQLKFVKALLSDEPVPDDRLRPVINSVDDFTSLESELLQEISELQKILDQTKSKFLAVKSSISSLVNEKNNLQKMKEVCSDAVENVDNVTSDKDIAKIKRLFQIVKADLARVVDIIYPEDNFHGLLRDLVNAYSKDGDEKYIEIGDVSLDCVQSLIEADIAMYHRNDKNKIRLVDLL
ncbi:titin homolog [Microplitis demolitor]|uniref:titin homolog n=1 Tax=Microplitis demolitor TaxID=69319 RepID=UPI0004CCACFD|nr:titin homolog [Microplitis demolitor]